MMRAFATCGVVACSPQHALRQPAHLPASRALSSVGDKYAMKTYSEKCTQQLIALVGKVREPLDKLIRKKVNSLLIVEVHARDIVDKFVRDSILDSREFAWESQLRFYWDRDSDDVVIRQCTGAFKYVCVALV